MKSLIAPLSSIAWTRFPLTWLWTLKWLAPGTISLIWQAETESYIVCKGGVESTLGNMGVESRGTVIDNAGATRVGFCTAWRDDTESLRVLLVSIVLPLEVLYDTVLIGLLAAVLGMDTGTLVESSKSNLSKLSVRSKKIYWSVDTSLDVWLRPWQTSLRKIPTDL